MKIKSIILAAAIGIAGSFVSATADDILKSNNHQSSLNVLPEVTVDNSLITFTADVPGNIQYGIYDVQGNNLVPEKSMQLVSGKNKDLLSSKILENVILVLKISSGENDQLYKIIPKIDIINKIDGISTKISAAAALKIMGGDTYVGK